MDYSLVDAIVRGCMLDNVQLERGKSFLLREQSDRRIVKREMYCGLGEGGREGIPQGLREKGGAGGSEGGRGVSVGAVWCLLHCSGHVR